MNMETNRAKAIDWWKTRTIIDKAFKLNDAKNRGLFEFERKIESLTGREIEIIWKNYKI